MLVDTAERMKYKYITKVAIAQHHSNPLKPGSQ